MEGGRTRGREGKREGGRKDEREGGRGIVGSEEMNGVQYMLSVLFSAH